MPLSTLSKQHQITHYMRAELQCDKAFLKISAGIVRKNILAVADDQRLQSIKPPSFITDFPMAISSHSKPEKSRS